MRRTIALLSILFLLFAVPVFSGQIVIDGKKYTLKDVINATSGEKKNDEIIFYSNPLSDKEATMVFIPGGYWDHENETLKDYWALTNTEFRVGIYNDSGDTSYEINETVIGGVPIIRLRNPIKVKSPYDQWTVRMAIQILDWKKPGVPYMVFQAIMDALEQQRVRHCLVGVEIKGKLMVYIVDKEDKPAEKEIRLMFHPSEAKTVDIK